MTAYAKKPPAASPPLKECRLKFSRGVPADCTELQFFGSNSEILELKLMLDSERPGRSEPGEQLPGATQPVPVQLCPIQINRRPVEVS